MEEKQQKGRILLMVAVAVCLISLAGMIFALNLKKDTGQGTFTPPPFEETAMTGTPVVSHNPSWDELDAKAFQFSVCGEPVLEKETADVWLTNPESNKVWLKLRILDKNDAVLGETGLIKPGEYVQTVRFTVIPKKGDEIKLKIMGYEPETYYSAGSAVLKTRIK